MDTVKFKSLMVEALKGHLKVGETAHYDVGDIKKVSIEKYQFLSDDGSTFIGTAEEVAEFVTKKLF